MGCGTGQDTRTTRPGGAAAAQRVLTHDVAAPRAPGTLPVRIVLDRLRSAFNVGNIFRLAESVRACGIVTCGYTATPPHPKLAKTARGCDRLVPCRHEEDADRAVGRLQAEGYTVYAVETTAGAPLVWDISLRFPAAFVFGNEALGVTEAVLDRCDAHVRLPACGCKNSVNVANCAAAVLYEAWRQRSAEGECG